ncbi:DUF4249 domain-containing protein [Pricia sp.]|uniref:DUF4249 domain-containing protein n=1 Tax=Pricia sp. TaxID=2268138 RepID=UPI003594937C
MVFKVKYSFSILKLTILFLYSCVEPFDAETGTFESVIIIEATLTDEMKTQQITLTRASPLEGDATVAESNAQVSIIDDSKNEYVFRETAPGVYTSANEFAAQPNQGYQLFVTTNNGRSYVSSSSRLTIQDTDEIDELYAERTNDTGNEGISIFIDNVGIGANTAYYRYEYEETYKVIAPFWTQNDLVETPPGSSQLDLVIKDQEERTCFRTELSNTITVANTNAFTENRLARFPIRFIDKDSYILANRYSILVKQFVVSRDAFTFYETLRDFSGSESLFSENQPGFFAGNIVSETDADEKVVGFFDVSAVSSKRIFFEHPDFFPDGPLPDFVNDCLQDAPRYDTLLDLVRSDFVRYLRENSDPEPFEGPYIVVADICGDCTVFGSNVVPDFWEE